jgi:hypothetical protein
MVGIFSFICSCSPNPKDHTNFSSSTNEPSISVVNHKKKGLTEMYLCLAKDTNWNRIKQESLELVKNSEFGFVYCYDDKSKIKDLSDLPEENVDYFCELIKRNGDPIEFNKVTQNYKKVEENGDINKVNFVLLDKKETNCNGNKKSKCRWYVFYVDNFFDNSSVYEKMKVEALKLPVDKANDKSPNKSKLGCTEVFFFKDKTNVPKLENDGGWGLKESSATMDKKFGKYLVGHIGLGCGYDLYFSKGF